MARAKATAEADEQRRVAAREEAEAAAAAVQGGGGGGKVKLKFVEKGAGVGGMFGKAKLSDAGRYFKQTGDCDGFNHAATKELCDNTYDMEVGGSASSTANLYVLLAAADKDISKNGLIAGDRDVWGINCNGGSNALFSTGSVSFCSPATAGALAVKLQSGVAEFWQAGKQLGLVTGLPAAVKLVVSLRHKGQSVTIL
jgi:hypothetical protein